MQADTQAAAPIAALSVPELVALVAALSALNALSIDIMLPALPDIGATFGLVNDNDRQLVVIAYIALFGVSQLIYGPLADAFGRRIVLVCALGLFLVAGALCVLAPNFELFLAARALQGVGAAATRVISNAIVRDLTEGRRMAQVMSLAMTLFMIVPIVAPGLGQLILFVAPWRWIFGALLIYAVALFLWVTFRLPETLRPEYRRAFEPLKLVSIYAGVLKRRQTLGYTLATMFAVACLFAYITSAEQIYVDVFHLGAAFPLAFASIAVVISIGTFLNARIVMRYGMRRISHWMTVWFIVGAALLAVLTFAGVNSFWVFIALFALTLGVFGMITGNFNALAMEPAGDVAGSASAIFGAITSTGGAIIGAFIARSFDGTVLPFLSGLVVLGVITLAVCYWTERGRVFLEGAPSAAPL